MFCIQVLDLDEGNGALWNEVRDTRHSTREHAREHLRAIRQHELDSDFESLCQYRVVEVDSAEYYSQPTDRLEY